MWFWSKIIAILTYPIRWFWESYEEYKEEESAWKIILLFVGSLSGVIIIGIALLLLVWYLIEYHMLFLIVVSLVVWLYVYIKSKIDENGKQALVQSQQQLYESAEAGYVLMRNIMYQILRKNAEYVGAVPPRTLQEIELLESHFVISRGICFYQFRINKADYNMAYTKAELDEFKRALQIAVTRSIQAGDYPHISFQNVIDCFHNVLDPIYIDTIEDLDTFYIIQAVFTDQTYADYYRNKEMNRQAISQKNSIPNASWDDEV